MFQKLLFNSQYHISCLVEQMDVFAVKGTSGIQINAQVYIFQIRVIRRSNHFCVDWLNVFHRPTVTHVYKLIRLRYLYVQPVKMDSLEKTVAQSVFILRLERTVSRCVPVMPHTVIMLKVVYSLTGVCTRILIIYKLLIK